VRKFLIIIVSLLFVVSGCSTSNDESYELDLDAFYSDSLEQGFFNNELYVGLNSNLNNLFGDIDFIDAKVGTNTGANANILAVFETDDIESLDKTITYYLEDTKEKYESYQPEEVEKIKNATKVVKGRYLILIICDNYENVETYLNNYLAN